MKKSYFNYLLVLALFAFIVSCRIPPKELQTLNFLEWSNSFLNKLNSIDFNNFDKKARKKFLDEEIFSKKQLLGFYENSSINFYTKEELESDFIQTLDDNSFILKQPIYITKKFGRIYVSSDAVEWFYVKPSNRKNIFNINHKIETQLDESKKNLDVFLTVAIDVNKEFLIKKDIKVEKPIIELDPTVFSFERGKKRNLPNLNKNILYIPENTIVKNELNVTGNIVNVRKDEDSIKTTALRDIYFYNNKKAFNLSFDRNKWNFSILRLKLDKDRDITLRVNEVYYVINITLNYKDKS